MVGTLTNVLFSDINRQLGPLLQDAGLVKEHEEPPLFGGAFKVVVARKPERSADIEADPNIES